MQNKTHFATLDGLRCVAAVCVVLFHWFMTQGFHWFGLGFLAVDFFFLLSGFVIAYSYEDRLLNSMSFGDFCRTRWLRLYPIIALGALLGLARFLAKEHLQHIDFRLSSYDWLKVFLANIFMIPNFGIAHLGNELYPLNVVLWSLLFEILANVAYAALIRHWSVSSLIGVSALGLFGLLLMMGHPSHEGVGQELNRGANLENFLGGFPRVIFSFFLGVLLFHLRKNHDWLRLKSANGIFLGVFLSVTLICPPTFIPLSLQLFFIAVLFPVILLLGANDNPNARVSNLYSVLGAISYPLYALHYPLLLLVTAALKAFHHYSPKIAFPLALPWLLSLMAFSWAANKLYDIPVRRFLSRRLFFKNAAVVRVTQN